MPHTHTHARTHARMHTHTHTHTVIAILLVFVSIALIEQQNEADETRISRPTIVILILTGIGALMIVTLMGCVVIYYWAPKYAEWLEDHFNITTC